jgi:hypothetical protein
MKDYSKFNSNDAAKYAIATNAYPTEFLSVWEVKRFVSSDEYKLMANKKQWKADGFTVRTKSYSDFTVMGAAKRRQQNERATTTDH